MRLIFHQRGEAGAFLTEGGVCQKGGLWQADSKVGEGRGRGKGPVSPSKGSGEEHLAEHLSVSKVGEGRGRGKGPGVCQKRNCVCQQRGHQSTRRYSAKQQLGDAFL